MQPRHILDLLEVLVNEAVHSFKAHQCEWNWFRVGAPLAIPLVRVSVSIFPALQNFNVAFSTLDIPFPTTHRFILSTTSPSHRTPWGMRGKEYYTLETDCTKCMSDTSLQFRHALTLALFHASFCLVKSPRLFWERGREGVGFVPIWMTLRAGNSLAKVTGQKPFW